MDKFSYLGSSDLASIEAIYKAYQKDPESVEESWRFFFEGFKFAQENYAEPSTGAIDKKLVDKEFNVLNLIEGYRKRGHLFTKTNPVRVRRQYFPTLDIPNFGLSNKDMETVFQAGKQIGIGPAKLKDIISHLEETYCKSIGVEFTFIRKPEIVNWFQSRMEKDKNSMNFTNKERLRIFNSLKKAVGFEKFIHKKFVGQKRFSLEGAEALIPALNFVIDHGANLGIEEFIIGMSHRGRLNVLANIMQKPYADIFQEFIGKQYDATVSLGDVKYHLGFGTSITTDSGKKVKLNLAPNPSHLETVSPVIEGITRAKIENEYDNDYSKAAPILIHGDAAMSAQGIVYEVIQMAQLPGYKSGGTIHLIINNQVGFTTNYLDGRSSTYSTDVAKVTRSPVFHVNGDDVEALIYSIQFAMEYRQRFHADVFIDILCYRRFGHNEGDEPRFTQPTLYKSINSHPNPRELYAKELINEGVIDQASINNMQADFDALLETSIEESRKRENVSIKQFLKENWEGFIYPTKKNFIKSPVTGIEKQKLVELADRMNNLPADRKFFRKTEKLVNDRKKMIENNQLDWAMGELLAYASLLEEGYPVRISGQDSERGTFSHRHAVHVLENTDEKYVPLQNISDQQAEFSIYNSLLSEYGVMGFEYGYALAHPNSLTVWEAQFGDFHNVAQAIIDQYISSAEEKWGLMNGLVLYLPHGFEGQGPEHSSARMERFLTLAVNENMQIVNTTTPANFFHLLRRQMKRNFRVPLIIFTPKSLLRHPKCVSSLDEMSEGGFKEVIDDVNIEVNEVKRLVFCTGKVYYDLLQKKEELNAQDIALVRLEQLHPFPRKQVRDIVKKYSNNVLTLWVQEEPQNMGAWNYIRNEFDGITEIEPVARLASGSPATGLNKLHHIGQEEIINKVFRKCDCELNNTYCGLQCVVGKTREEILKQHRYIFKD